MHPDSSFGKDRLFGHVSGRSSEAEPGREQPSGDPGTDLAVILAYFADLWKLRIGPPFPNLSFNYAAPAVRADGSHVVLKICRPNPEMQTEIDALRLYAGKGSVRLLDADPDLGALLLERLMPGTPLAEMASEKRDAHATTIAASVMQSLWRPVPSDHRFPTVHGWAGGLGRLRTRFEGGTGPLPTALVERAEGLFNELLATSAVPVVLHGDLHHDNILASRGRWLAIDPKGVVGEPAYEVGALLRNLWQDRHAIHDPQRLLARRAALLSDALAVDFERVCGWAVAQAVLSAWWCIEDESDCWRSAVATAELLASIQP